MKKYFLSFICACCLFSCGYAADTAAIISSSYRPLPIPVFEETLKDILIPNWVVLNRKNLEKGPIVARKVTAGCNGSTVGKGWTHRADYTGGCITTLVEGVSDNHRVVGEQSVSMGSEVSRSRDYTIETICEKKYIVHHHCGFRVYSTATEQFVVAS